MKVLVIGSGGREHALCWKLSQSRRVKKIYCAPGNGGTQEIAENISIKVEEISQLVDFAKKEKIDLTIVGPEVPLCLGIVDEFEKVGLRIFGPNRKAAQLEGSKAFAKELLLKYGIPTARAGVFDSVSEARKFSQPLGFPQVIKADGLASGKGVIIAMTVQEAEKAIADIMEDKVFGEAGRSVVIEEFLEGEEASLHILVSGNDYIVLPGSQDHKRVGDGDTGPNTGGMGAYSPAPVLSDAVIEEAERLIVKPFLTALLQEGIEYRGVLYIGLMITLSGVKVLEFNCRFGDPETQVLLPRIETDLVELVEAVIDKNLKNLKFKISDRVAVCVVATAGGYPGNYSRGAKIEGLEKVKDLEDIMIFHGGTLRDGDNVLTNGGRVLGIVGVGDHLSQMLSKTYDVIKGIHFSSFLPGVTTDRRVKRGRFGFFILDD